MTMSLAIDILLWFLLSLALLTVTVVWTVILAVVWATTRRFMGAYQQAAQELESEEEETPPNDLYF